MTTARVITPRGRSAIAVVLVEGPDALSAIERCFRGAAGTQLTESPPNRIRFGVWGDDRGEEVVVVPTTPTSAEVHCHGGVAASAAVLQSLAEHGVPPNQSGHRQARTIEEDAKQLLAFASTQRTAGILLDQANGALSDAIGEVHRAVEREDSQAALAMLDELLRFEPLADHLTTPWRVVLTGPPNVGKSSLINALAGYQRALVFDRPGTTRDVVTAVTAIDGWPIELADTAGLRESDDPIEQAGVLLALTELDRADVTVRVRDARQPATPISDQPEGERAAATTRLVRVANKRDLTPDTPLAGEEVATVAPSGEGIGDLLNAIARALALPASDPGRGVPFRRWQIERLRSVRNLIADSDPQSCDGWQRAAAALLAMKQPRDFDD